MLLLRKKIALYFDKVETTTGLVINLIILGLILLSSLIFILETYPLAPEIIVKLDWLDTIILIIFTCEYILRLWTAENRSKFFFSFFSLIDFISILPLLIEWIDFRFFRIFRWFRIIRIIRFWHIGFKILGIKAEDNIIYTRIFLTVFCLLFVYAGLIYQIEHQVNSGSFKNFFDAFYFVVVTMTTVGYGDVTPLSDSGKAVTLLMILTGVLLIPWQFGELIKQLIKNKNLIESECSGCGLSHHDSDAMFCKRCGTVLKQTTEVINN